MMQYVATYLRTPAELAAVELAAVVQYTPFAVIPHVGDTHTLLVSVLPDAPPLVASVRLLGLCNETDVFHVHGREAYWLHGAGGPSRFTGATLEKALQMPATMRNMTPCASWRPYMGLPASMPEIRKRSTHNEQTRRRIEPDRGRQERRLHARRLFPAL
jgi:hypothetical protein